MLKPDWKELSAAQRADLIMPLWNGGMSAGDIAMRFSNATRSAVLGQISRLGGQRRIVAAKAPSNRRVKMPVVKAAKAPAEPKLSRREAAARAKKPRAARVVTTAQAQFAGIPNGIRAEPQPEKPLPPERPRPSTIIGVSDFVGAPRAGGQCRWPFGDPLKPGFGFCGKEIKRDGTSYCPEHGRIAYTRPEPKKRKAGA